MKIEHITTDEERAFYSSRDVVLENCVFAGPADGESALKESRNVTVRNCRFDLRYPLWHNETCLIDTCELTENCRAALWYSSDVRAVNTRFAGVKAFRECNHVTLKSCEITSPECGWFCRDAVTENCRVEGEYFFFHAAQVAAQKLVFRGKYSFQYLENGMFEGCTLDTKDAFWHAKNVTVRDSVIRGEYLGWYSEGLTLVNCRIEGTQPLCYCKRLTLINCTMTSCDLAFEYSDVSATITGSVDSIKNPLAGKIVCDGVGELICDEHARGECAVEIR